MEDDNQTNMVSLIAKMIEDELDDCESCFYFQPLSPQDFTVNKTRAERIVVESIRLG